MLRESCGRVTNEHNKTKQNKTKQKKITFDPDERCWRQQQRADPTQQEQTAQNKPIRMQINK
jgi:hypothetical protein